ncbi:MAG: SUMF1/EgtB/PvdO family nonheme iron enzyme [Pirellulaceae bacterium]|nr:SUMF1/EgtB/PvdO family nonheme iron enzyme [Pirellulaceae bacterium]
MSGRKRRVVRGGGWHNQSRNCRCSYRNHNDPDNRNDKLGFRVLCLFGQDSC